MRYPYALQLYSVRDYFAEDADTAAVAVAAAGYEYVELVWSVGRDPESTRGRMRHAGLTPISMHVAYEEVIGETDKIIRAAGIFEIRHVVVPWLGAEQCPDNAAWRSAARALDQAGALLRAEGVRLSYHNHAHEFSLSEGDVIFDLLFAHSDPDHLAIQLDMGWAAIGDVDTAALLRRYAGRIATVHVKDFKEPVGTKSPVVTELGRGIMDWPALLPVAKEAGAEWFIVEQDESETDSMESASVNAAFMRQLNGLVKV